MFNYLGSRTKEVDANTLIPLIRVPLYAARVYNDADITIATGGSPAALTFNQETFDYGNLHDTGSNPSRLTAPAGGLYLITGQAIFVANATGIRLLRIDVNGVGIARDVNVSPSGTNRTDLNICTMYPLMEGDYVELKAYQTSGGDLNVDFEAGISPHFMMCMVGPVSFQVSSLEINVQDGVGLGETMLIFKQPGYSVNVSDAVSLGESRTVTRT